MRHATALSHGLRRARAAQSCSASTAPTAQHRRVRVDDTSAQHYTQRFRTVRLHLRDSTASRAPIRAPLSLTHPSGTVEPSDSDTARCHAWTVHGPDSSAIRHHTHRHGDTACSPALSTAWPLAGLAARTTQHAPHTARTSHNSAECRSTLCTRGTLTRGQWRCPHNRCTLAAGTLPTDTGSSAIRA